MLFRGPLCHALPESSGVPWTVAPLRGKEMTMVKATGKKSFVGLGLLVLVLVLVPPLLVAGCSSGKSTTTTTTTEAVTTTTSEVPDTSTSTTEAETTTTAKPGEAAVSHQETESRFTYAGTWKSISATSASGKSFAVADAAGCSVTVRFSGIGMTWIAKTSPAYGQAKVEVDGGTAQTVDLYSVSTSWKKKVWDSGPLEAGAHTVVISWTGVKSEGATGTNINVDAIVVAGVLTGLIQQDNADLAYIGTWKKTTSSSTSKGSFVYCDNTDASVTIAFSGTELVWIARTGPSYGQAKVTVDGGAGSTVDLYSAATKSQVKVWDSGALEMGSHLVMIERLGTKNAGANGTSINVDAFDVTGVLK
jgi:hypothetical protein